MKRQYQVFLFLTGTELRKSHLTSLPLDVTHGFSGAVLLDKSTNYLHLNLFSCKFYLFIFTPRNLQWLL